MQCPFIVNVRVRSYLHSLLRAGILAAICASCSACAWFRPADPFAYTSPCNLSQQMTTDDLIAHINANIARVRSWRSMSAKITVPGGPGGLPVSLNALMAVEKPRKFRLKASMPISGATAADLGSNAERFWFYVKNDQQPGVITCNHEDLRYASRQLPLPFEPDWLMEALGVVPLDPNEIVDIQETDDSRIVNLWSSRTSPSGEPVAKLTTVDRCHGVIVWHALYGSDRKLIASARASQFIRDTASGAVLPTRIELEWPEQQVSLTVQLRDLEVNSSIGGSYWQMPDLPVPVHQLGRPMNAHIPHGRLQHAGYNDRAEADDAWLDDIER